MDDKRKTKSVLIQELTETRRRLAGFQESRGGMADTGEKILSRKKSAHRVLFESTKDAIFLLKGDVLIDCNGRTLKIFRYQKEDLVGRSLHAFSPPLQPDGGDSRKGLFYRISAASTGTPQFFKWRFLTCDAGPLDTEINLSSITIDKEDFLQAIVHDITERELAEQALRESENKFRDLTEKSVVGVYLIQDWVFKYVNPKFADIFGYSVGELTTTIGPEDVVLPEDWPMVRENLRMRISEEASSIHSEFRIVTKNGELRNVEVYGSRTMYQGVPAVVGSLLDITERKRSEELLRQAERKYRGIFENAVEGIFQTPREGLVVSANPALAKMLGYGSPEELISSVKDIRHQLYVVPQRRSDFLQILERDGVALGFECEFYRKDGSRIWVSLNARQARNEDGETLYYEGTVEDVTQKKAVENELRLLNDFNRAIIDHAPVAIFTLDKDGVITSINPVMATLFGLGPRAEEKLLGFNWLRNPYTIKCGLSCYIEGGLKGEPFQLWDFPFITYRGDSTIFMDFKGVPLKGKNGEIEGLLCIIEDVTERVATRAKLMQEAKKSAIGRLAAGIAHELNNPLGTLVAYSELASGFLKSLRGHAPKGFKLDKLTDYLSIIEEEAFRCKGVTTDILSLFQKDGLEFTEIDLDQLLDNILELATSDRTDVKIVRERTSPLPNIFADTSALRQVFVNLITNAVDAVEGSTDAAILIRTGYGEGLVTVEVEDNGMGIPDAIMDKIFEPFFTTKKSKSGIGLGLSLCYDLVSDMGGIIKAVSTPGLGTTFSVALPVETERNGRHP